jgi:hypothetical protein
VGSVLVYDDNVAVYGAGCLILKGEYDKLHGEVFIQLTGNEKN